MSKKRILFVIESLVAAGAEKSLVTLLSLLDYSKYDVDLQLFSFGGEFERYLPEQVNLLLPIEVFDTRKGRNLKAITFRNRIARLSYSLAIRLKKTNNRDKARLFWRLKSNCIPKVTKTYDVAIGYAQGIPTFYVVDKVNAAKRLSWVNVSYHLKGTNREFQHRFYQQIDHIVTVSKTSCKVFQGIYPDCSQKMTVIWDILNPDFITRLSNEPMECAFPRGLPILLTVARLNKSQKGYDVTLEACKILRDRGLCFKWYAIGRGSYRKEMEEYIRTNGLQDFFILLGTTPNPYPYMKNCTIYVQTSRHEGYGLSIAEARILNKPVVTTEYDSVYNQMVPNKNGLVVPINATAVADAIQRLLEDKSLYNSIVDFQRQEKKGNVEEIEKFYQLIEN